MNTNSLAAIRSKISRARDLLDAIESELEEPTVQPKGGRPILRPTPDEADFILRKYRGGVSIELIAEQMGYSRGVISRELKLQGALVLPRGTGK